MTEMTETQIEWAKMFAEGRVSARKYNRPPEMLFAECWYPTVAGKPVRNANAPEHGYDTRADAVKAAKSYRDSCRAALVPMGGKGD